MSEQLIPELETMDYPSARAAIRALPEDADFESLLSREEARAKGPRPRVRAAILARLGRAEVPTEGEAAGTDAERSPPSDPPPSSSVGPPSLPEAPWTTKKWNRAGGHLIYFCRSCPHQTMDIGVAYEHARTHPQKKE
jgi:hypothetical protein